MTPTALPHVNGEPETVRYGWSVDWHGLIAVKYESYILTGGLNFVGIWQIRILRFIQVFEH